MKKTSGFTLIELMIVCAIVAILAGIAYPSYRSYVQRSQRTEAKTALMENAQFMERTFTLSGAYNQTAAGVAITTSTTLPVASSPRNGTAIYNISLSAVGATSYTLQAEPVEGGPMAGDSCGTLTLSNTGAKGQSSGGSTDSCWNR